MPKTAQTANRSPESRRNEPGLSFFRQRKDTCRRQPASAVPRMTGTEKAQHRKHAEPYQHIGKFRCLNLFGQRIIKKESRHHGPKARKGQRQRAVQKNADSRLDQRSPDTPQYL